MVSTVSPWPVLPHLTFACFPLTISAFPLSMCIIPLTIGVFSALKFPSVSGPCLDSPSLTRGFGSGAYHAMSPACSCQSLTCCAQTAYCGLALATALTRARVTLRRTRILSLPGSPRTSRSRGEWWTPFLPRGLTFWGFRPVLASLVFQRMSKRLCTCIMGGLPRCRR